ncbi:MAG TPA: CU044_2847 family protein [Methylocella sp.]|nr:CU044_2847 family protein [Methylocella sp.]
MPGEIIVELSEGRKLYFGGTAATRLAEVSAKGKVATMAADTFKSALGSLGDLVKVLEESVGNLPKRPDKVELEFGASLKGDCDLWIVRGEGEADFKVTLSWGA